MRERQQSQKEGDKFAFGYNQSSKINPSRGKIHFNQRRSTTSFSGNNSLFYTLSGASSHVNPSLKDQLFLYLFLSIINAPIPLSAAVFFPISPP